MSQNTVNSVSASKTTAWERKARGRRIRRARERTRRRRDEELRRKKMFKVNREIQ